VDRCCTKCKQVASDIAMLTAAIATTRAGAASEAWVVFSGDW
jgi:hypothetical protein